MDFHINFPQWPFCQLINSLSGFMKQMANPCDRNLRMLILNRLRVLTIKCFLISELFLVIRSVSKQEKSPDLVTQVAAVQTVSICLTVGSMEAPSKAFLLFFLIPDWLKLNHLKGRMECGFSDIFLRHICSTVGETTGMTN